MPALLLLAGGLLWLDAFVNPDSTLWVSPGPDPPLFSLLYEWMIVRPLTANVLAFVLLLFQVFIINHIASSKEFISTYSVLPGLFYLLLMSNTDALISPHPLLFSNVFVLLALNKVLKVYQEQEAEAEVFSSAMLAGIGGLIYLPAFVYYLLVVFSLLIYARMSSRSLVASLLGLATPFVFLGTWFFVTGELHQEIQKFFSLFEAGMFFRYAAPGTYEKILLVVLAAFSLFSLLRLRVVYMPEKLIRVRRKTQVLFLMFFLSGLLFVFGADHARIHHTVMAIPVSLSLALFFADARRKVVSELFFILLLLFLLSGRIAEGLLW